MDMDVERDELLISRVVDNEATKADWAELELLAQSGADVWSRLAAAIKAEATMRNVLDRELAVADGVDLPTDTPQVARRRLSRSTSGRRWSATLGWVAALLIAALWQADVGSSPELVDGDHAASGSTAQLVADEITADDALIRYYDLGVREGRLVGELPRLVVESRPLPDQEAVEIIYMRRLIERRTVDKFYEVDRTEAGIPVATPVTFDHVSRRGSI